MILKVILTSPDLLLIDRQVVPYVPGVAALQDSAIGQGAASKSDGMADDDGAPPKRPDHDLQVEQFLKGQYKSQSAQDVAHDEDSK